MPSKTTARRPAPRVLEEAAALARLVDGFWRKRGRRAGAFADAALAGIRAHRPHRTLDADSIVEWSLSEQKLPRQFSLQSLFGEPPLTLFWSERFVIEALFWIKPDVTIHDHMFSGAFTVLQGTSLHCAYEYEIERDLDGKVRFGALRPVRRELLRRGDSRRVVAGQGHVHGVWHLACPSVTLLVRTHSEGARQYNYWTTGLAIDYQALKWQPLLNPIVYKRLALMRFLSRVDPAKRDAYARTLLESCGFAEAFLYLEAYFQATPAGPERAKMVSAAIRRHGPDAAIVCRSFEQHERLRSIPWEAVASPGPRLLLALHFGGVSRTDSERLIRALAGKGAPAPVKAWLAELDRSETPRVLVRRLKAAFL